MNRNNYLDKFNKQCEDDFRKIIASLLLILKKHKSQSGGMHTGLNFNLLNSLINTKTGKFYEKKNLSDKHRLSQIASLNIPNFYPNNTRSSLSSEAGLNNYSNKEIPKMPINRKRILHECQVYEYLKIKSQTFIDICTCFERCSNDSVFLRDCGITFIELILENLRNTNLFQDILKKLFFEIHILHLLGVAHNNLDCSNVLVGKRDNINIGSMSNNKLKNLPEESYLNIPFVRKNIDVRLINFSKATILQPGLEVDLDYLKGIFNYYNNVLKTLFP
jgi:hypothetical protein